MRRHWWAGTGLTFAMVVAGAAHGQTVAPQATQSSPADSPDTAMSEVVVTGSRLQTTLLNSPSPIVAVTREQLEQTGLDNLERALIQIPAIGTGLSDTNSENFYAAAGLNLVDLRHLGYTRTLVLINGRRQVAGDGFSNAVDINSIPTPLVDRVEVVTGGASAVYGADAVSGVINIILKDHYEGVDVRLRGGITSYGDGGQYGASFLAGHNFAEGRGNVTMSFLYDKSEGVSATARDYAQTGNGYFVNPNAGAINDGNPFYLTPQGIRYYGTNQKGFVVVPLANGVIDPRTRGGYSAYTPTADGSAVTPYDFGSRGLSPDGQTTVGGDGGFFQPYDNLSLPLERYVTSLNASYKLTDHAELFGEARFAYTKTRTRWQPAADFEIGQFPIQASNPYVPANLRTILAAQNDSVFYFGREYEAFGRRGGDDERFTQQYTGGVRGDVPGGRFKYEAFIGYGETDLHSDLVGGRNEAKFLQSVNVITLNGAPACADVAARAAGCQPFNPFNPTSTPAGIAYSLQTDTYAAKNTLGMAGANITGDLFKLPAGMVTGALGVEGRRNSGQTFPSLLAQKGGIQLFFEQPEKGRVDVGEVFGETRVPLLKGLPLINELTFQGAVRYSDYNVNGGQVSWNVGGVYSPINSVNFRVMQSRAVRAPNVNELYARQSQTFFNINDPCSTTNVSQNANRATNCAALGLPTGFVQTTGSKATYTGGNPNLDVETADTLTVGMTVAPRFIPHLSFTIDYFKVDITGAIGAIDAQTLVNTCVDLPIAVGANAACGAITRDPANRQITGVFATQQNIGRLFTRGVDFTATYDVPLQQMWQRLPGRLVLNMTGNYLAELRQFTNADNPATERRYEGYRGLPKWQILGTATYALDKVAVTWRTRFLDGMKLAGSDLVTNPLPSDYFDNPNLPSKVYNDLSIAYALTPRTNLRLNVDNIFNVHPPSAPNNINEGTSYGSPYGAAGIWPNLGTTFSFVLQHKFL